MNTIQSPILFSAPYTNTYTSATLLPPIPWQNGHFALTPYYLPAAELSAEKLIPPVISQPFHEKQPMPHRAFHLAWTGVLMATGLLLNLLPIRQRAGKVILPTDWKLYAKVILGIAATRQLNEGLNWKPSPWLAGMEMVAMMNPLTLSGPPSMARLKQLMITAPVVGAVVQGAHELNQRLVKSCGCDPNAVVTPMLMRLGISVGIGFLSVRYLPKLYKPLFKWAGIENALASPVGNSGVVMANLSQGCCAYGCTPGGLICFTELGGVLGGMGQWLQHRFSKNTDKAGL